MGYHPSPQKHTVAHQAVCLFCAITLQEGPNHLSTLLAQIDGQHGEQSIDISRTEVWLLTLVKQTERKGAEGCVGGLDHLTKRFSEIVDDLLTTCDQCFYDGKRWIHMPIFRE